MTDTDDRLAAHVLRQLHDLGYVVELIDEQSPVRAQAPSLDTPGLMIVGEGQDVYAAVVHLAQACGIDLS